MNRAFICSKLLGLALVFLLAVALVPFSFGQAISGNLVGSVFDPSGAVVANADVEALNVATGVKTTTKTTSSGEYRFNNLPIGTYTVGVRAQGFASTGKQVTLELNQTGTLNFSLAPGAVSTTVEVSGAAPVIDTTTAQLTSTYDERAAADLPTVSTGGAGLGVLNLSLYSAGVASPGGLGAGTGPSIGGQRSRNNNFTIEGVDNNNKTVTGPLTVVPNDAVASFTLLENQFGAEFGHSSGGQFNTVVMSGTNSFHGKAYEYLQNRNLNGVDYILANTGVTKNPRYDNNRYGGQVGGPIVKNKLFFFFNFEYNPVGQSTTPSAVEAPTANGLATLAAQTGVNQNNFSIFKKYVPVATSACTPNVGSCNAIMFGSTPIESGLLSIIAPNYQNYKNSAASADFTISDRDQLRARYVYNGLHGADTAATLPVFYSITPTISHVFTLGEYHTFSPTISNEFRVGYNRYYNVTPTGNFSFPGLDQFPNLTFDELGLQVGPDPNGPQFTIQNTYQLVDNISWTRGRHTLQFGIEGRKYISPQNFTQRSRGDYDYSTLQLYLTDQMPDSLAERSVGPAGYDANQIALYWYASDTFRIRPNVTLTFGLRHEYTTIPEGERLQKMNSSASVPGLAIFDEPRAPKKNFAPRVGIAWSPGTSGNTSVRAGFGMAYDVLYDNIGILSKPPQLNQTYDCPGSPTCPSGSFLVSGGIPPGIAPIPDLARQRALTASYVPPNQRDPYSISWNLSVQRVFAKDYTAEVRYVGTRGVDLNVQNRLNIRSRVTPTSFLPTYLQRPSKATLDALPVTLASLKAESPYVPAFDAAGFNQTFLVGFMPWGDSIYHGMAAQLNRRFSNGLQFQAAYTFSHNIDNSTADFFSTVLTPRRPQDFQNMHVDRATSALDRRQRFTIMTIYDVPFFKHSNYLMRNIAGNWEIAPIYTYESPEFATVQAGRDANLNLDSWGDRAIFNPAGIPGTGTDVVALKNTAGATVAYLAADAAATGQTSTAQYIRTGSGALSNIGRNTMPTQHINNWDFSILKRVSFTERFKFEFGGQMLNLFNHPQFTPGYINAVNSANTSITTSAPARNYVTPGKAEFNNAKAVFSSNPRTLQIAAKFIF